MANAILNVGQTGGQVNISTATAPATPAAGVVTLYAGTDKALHVKNSDGTDITIAAAGSSPIEVVNTTTLVSEGIGASAGSAADSIVLGNAATSNFNNTVVIGKTVAAKKIGDIAVGSNIATPATSAQCSVYLGNCITPGGNCAGATILGQVMVGFKISQNQANENVGGSVLLGHCLTNNHQNGTGSDGDTIVGICSTTACSRGNNAILGRSNNGGGSANTIIGYANSYTATDSLSHRSNVLVGAILSLGANTCNSIVIGSSSNATNNCTIVIGNTSCTKKPSELAIGNSIATPATSAMCSVYVGNCITPGGDCTGASVLGQVMVGFKISQNETPENVGGSVLIGHCISSNNQPGVGSDLDTMVGGMLTTACSRGNNTVIGRMHTVGGSSNTIIGYNNNYTATDSLSHYYNMMAGSFNSLGANVICSVVIGHNSCITQTGAIAIGSGSVASNAGATVIGNGLTSEKADTVHVNSLIAFGQAASKTHAIGSTGGTVTVDFDNGNVQTLSLTSSIATLTKSNPISGGVYTFQITQAGSGSYTIAWGADVKWPGGTPPTLSTAVGAVDYVTLVYTGTNYYGNANLNFS